MTFDFSNKNVIVTGASRGIGLAIAKAFSLARANVTVIAETDEVFKSATLLESETGCSVTAFKCDISDIDQVRETLQTMNHVDVLVNNAGLELITPIDALGAEGDQVEYDFKKIIDTNVLGTFYMTRYTVPKMPAGSSILITCSIWSRTAVAEFSAYCASKHATLGFMRSMSKELASKDIRVNGVCPGWVRTESSMRSLRAICRRTGLSEDDALNEILGSQSLKGLMEPADITDSYLFLASDAASNITGQAVNVDRGDVMS